MGLGGLRRAVFGVRRVRKDIARLQEQLHSRSSARRDCETESEYQHESASERLGPGLGEGESFELWRESLRRLGERRSPMPKAMEEANKRF